jgi:MoxR-like ATPase
MRYQVDYDGAVVEAETELITDTEIVLNALFEQFSWKLTEPITKKGAKYHITTQNIHTVQTLELNVFVGNIRDESRNIKEKKIQLNNSDPRVIESGRINIILGIYCRKKTDTLENLLFSCWSIDNNTNYLSNPSIRGLNTDLLQLAKTNGFIKRQFGSNYVYVFRPEFIFYCIDNLRNFQLLGNVNESYFVKPLPFPTQNRIFFGCPGTGKSYKVTEITKNYPKRQWERVTFHPEYDYSSFVGTFKPTSSKDETGKDIIKYEFVPQAFTDMYVKAWKDPENPYFLLIEEINRGNCAEIFGDIFQLLDRNANYEVAPSQELKKHLVKEFGNDTHEGIAKGLKLPPNLSLLATMNTSDQSLFPMDSAFKRRWEWQYVPIDYEDAEKQEIRIGEKTYSWASFLKIINEKIYNITESEDKQMGNRFVNMPEIDGRQIITEDVLKNKIMFYLWFDVFKNEDSKDKNNYIFRKKETGKEAENFKYPDLFDKKTGTETLLAFLAYNGIVEK